MSWWKTLRGAARGKLAAEDMTEEARAKVLARKLKNVPGITPALVRDITGILEGKAPCLVLVATIMPTGQLAVAVVGRDATETLSVGIQKAIHARSAIAVRGP